MNNVNPETELNRTIHEQAQQRRIEARAFELYKLRGGEHGHDVEDWIRAEGEVIFTARSQMRVKAA